MLVMLLLLSALGWLLYYLVHTDPFAMGSFFALVMTGLQFYLMWRMVRWGKKRLRGTGSRLRALPLLYRRKARRSRANPAPAPGPRQYVY